MTKYILYYIIFISFCHIMEQTSKNHRNVALSAMLVASIAALNAGSDTNTKVPEKARAALCKVFKSPKLRPESGSVPPKWAIAGPSAELMTHSSDRSECNRHAEGNGNYEIPERLNGNYRILYPQTYAVDENGRYDLWLHFHGSEMFEAEWLKEMRNTILVTLHQRGLSGVYLKRFESPHQWQQLQNVISAAVSRHYDTDSRPRRIGLSGWSAGCGALKKISDFDMEHVDAMLLLDGVHGTYRGANNEPIYDYTRFRHATSLPVNFPVYSQLASLGGRFMGISHSSVPCSGTCQRGDKSYASTTATARNMIWAVGGTEADMAPKAFDPEHTDAPYYTYDQGNFHVAGHRGASGNDHCTVFNDVVPFLKKAKTEAGFE